MIYEGITTPDGRLWIESEAVISMVRTIVGGINEGLGLEIPADRIELEIRRELADRIPA